MNENLVGRKKKLLAAWSGPYLFNEEVVPLIPHLAERYDIFVMLVDWHMPAGLKGLLQLWKNKGVIEDFLVVPKPASMVKFHWFMRLKIEFLRKKAFDVFLSASMMQVFERYLLDLVLPASCVKICFCMGTTYLMEKKSFACSLLGYRDTVYQKKSKQQMGGFILDLITKARNVNSFNELISKFMKKIKALLFSKIRKKIMYYLDRFIFPFVLAGKSFPLKKYDQLTQLGTDQFDHVIFYDEVEAKAHAVLFDSSNVHIAQHSAKGSCRCNGVNSDSLKILSPLTGFVGVNRISMYWLYLFYRDINSVIHESGAKQVDIRLHPRETGRWPYQLKEYLCQRGIETTIVGSEKPIREIMCDYLGMAGFASNSMRNARYSCDFAFVVGFEAISKARYTDPRFVYGNSEGIDWIREDGSYDPGIFIREKHILPKRKTVVEILSEIADGKEEDNVCILNNL